MTAHGPYNFTIERTFEDPLFDNEKHIINYTMKHDYTLDSPPNANMSIPIKQINFDGQDIWYQMNKNRPDFWKAWQSMTVASSSM